MSLIKVEPSGLHEEGIEEEERPVDGGTPEQSGEDTKQEQPAPNKTSEPDIPSFRYGQRDRHNVPMAITLFMCVSKEHLCKPINITRVHLCVL